MLGELITLPLRVGIRATQLWLRAAEETAAVVAGTAGRLIDRAISNEPSGGAPHGVEPEGGAPRREPPLSPPAPAREPLARTEPVHVSEEPVLVEEIAEPGAEDGAGASLHVRAPWDGYEHMKADDVIDRVSGANPAELAAIQLYENQTKGRTTVLQAVERELRISTGSGSQS